MHNLVENYNLDIFNQEQITTTTTTNIYKKSKSALTKSKWK